MFPENLNKGGINEFRADGYSDGNNPGMAYQVIQDRGEYEEECGLDLYNR